MGGSHNGNGADLRKLNAYRVELTAQESGALCDTTTSATSPKGLAPPPAPSRPPPPPSTSPPDCPRIPTHHPPFRCRQPRPRQLPLQPSRRPSSTANFLAAPDQSRRRVLARCAEVHERDRTCRFRQRSRRRFPVAWGRGLGADCRFRGHRQLGRGAGTAAEAVRLQGEGRVASWHVGETDRRSFVAPAWRRPLV